MLLKLGIVYFRSCLALAEGNRVKVKQFKHNNPAVIFSLLLLQIPVNSCAGGVEFKVVSSDFGSRLWLGRGAVMHC